MGRVVGLWAVMALIGCKEEEGPGFAQQCAGVEDDTMLLQRGLLDGSEYVEDTMPTDGSGAWSFVSHDCGSGRLFVVSGSSLLLNLNWVGGDSLAGRTVLVGLGRECGHHRVVMGDGDNPLAIELFFNQLAPSQTGSLYLGIEDDNGEVGEIYEVPIQVTQVGAGDVQVNVNWCSAADVDLFVTDPEGYTYWFANPAPAGSAGELDRDGNRGCITEDERSENVFFPEGLAPKGTYSVGIDLWSACDVSGATDYRVTVVNQGAISTWDGSLAPADAFLPDDPGVPIATFTVE